MNETHNRLWRGWYDLWHEADASKPKPSYEEWLEARIEEYEVSFKLYDDAMRRATKIWQKAHPESARVWPDAAKLAAWLMERVTALESFARRVSVHVFDSFELDYCDFIDVGVETGVLRKEAYDPAKHGESDCEPGDNFYVLAIPSQEAT